MVLQYIVAAIVIYDDAKIYNTGSVRDMAEIHHRFTLWSFGALALSGIINT